MNPLFESLFGQQPPVTGGVDLSELPNSHGGSVVSGLLRSLYSGATLPGDVATGRVNPYSNDGLTRVHDMAGLAMTGGFAGAPRGALGSGPIRAYQDDALAQFRKPRSIQDAKYVMPDGRLVGAGDQTHEYIASKLGHGIGEDGIDAFLRESGAARVNIGAYMSSGAEGASLAGRPTDAQAAVLGRLAQRARSPLGISMGDDFAEVMSPAELRSFLTKGNPGGLGGLGGMP